MRDDNDYAKMTLAELQESLCGTAKQLATWHSALAESRKTHARSFCESYAKSMEKATAGRVRDAELGSVADLGVIFEDEGNVAFHTTIRDLLVVLIENYV